MSQNEQVAWYLKVHGSITSLEAYNAFGILRLSARIHDLRAAGMLIYSMDETAPNRYGIKTRYTRYYLHDKNTK